MIVSREVSKGTSFCIVRILLFIVNFTEYSQAIRIKEGAMLRTAAKGFGFVLLAMGIMGFIPGLTPDDHLLGVFHVDPLHNLVHLGSGVVALWAGYTSRRASRMYFQVFGIIYGLVAIMGFLAGDNDVLGLMANNTADNWLHVVIAGSALLIGFGSKSGDL